MSKTDFALLWLRYSARHVAQWPRCEWGCGRFTFLGDADPVGPGAGRGVAKAGPLRTGGCCIAVQNGAEDRLQDPGGGAVRGARRGSG